VMLDALALGLASGVSCVAGCAPLALPFVLCEEQPGLSKVAARLALMLLGRLIGYLAVGLALGALGMLAASSLDPALARTVGRISNGAAGLFLLATGLAGSFPGKRPCRVLQATAGRAASALLIGLATGLSLCPPFVAAASRVFGSYSSLQGALYFGLFFLGTSLYFAPLLGVSFIRGHQSEIRTVARISCILVGGYFVLFLGVLGA
jgi:sulfite exporter TauE/SafE